MPEPEAGPRAAHRPNRRTQGRHSRRHHGRRDRILSRILILAALSAGAWGCGGEPQPPAAERAAAEAALDSAYATFTRAYAEANVQLLMDQVYAPDAFYLPPDSPILQGQDQFRGQFSFLERYARDDVPGPEITFDITDRDMAGDLAYDIGTFTLRDPGAPEDQPGSRGKFIVIWKRIHGEWRIWADGYSPLESPTLDR